jgi:hypothetical protein
MRSERDADRCADEPPAGIPAADLPLTETGEVVVTPSEEPPALPEDRTIHPRKRLPIVPTGTDVPDDSPSPPTVIREPER